ncbi:hypothetical protein, partial [Paenibacillus glucanolyticus]
MLRSSVIDMLDRSLVVAALYRVPRFLAFRRRSIEEPPSGAGPVSSGRSLPSPCAFGGGGGGVGALPLRAPSRASGGALRPPAGAAP